MNTSVTAGHEGLPGPEQSGLNDDQAFLIGALRQMVAETSAQVLQNVVVRRTWPEVLGALNDDEQHPKRS